LNQTRGESWRGSFVTRPVGGYGYSGWIWETVDGRFRIKQGPKLLSVETSVPEEDPSVMARAFARAHRK
jgi:betaine-aldehyde dehydrogenase